MRTTLESGAWIEHVPVQDLKGKHKRDLERVGKPQPVFRDGEFDQEATMSGISILDWVAAKRDAVWALVITGWSWDLEPPRIEAAADGRMSVTGAEAFGEIPLGDFEELEALMGPFEEALGRAASPKGSTTSSSNGSSPARAGGSRKG